MERNSFRITAFLMGTISGFMVWLGLTAYYGMGRTFRHSVVSSQAKLVYNQFYFVPYLAISVLFLLYALVPLHGRARLFFASLILGVTVFGLFFIQVGNVGHDFGHVIYGGCFESAELTRLMINVNLTSVATALIITLAQAVKLRNVNRHAI